MFLFTVHLCSLSLSHPLSSTGMLCGPYKSDWIFAISQGNYVALNESEINELNEEEYELKIGKSYETLANAGAHYVIDSIAELPPVIEDINRRLAAGERP